MVLEQQFEKWGICEGDLLLILGCVLGWGRDLQEISTGMEVLVGAIFLTLPQPK